ncbi:MAG: LysR family transcriptional regulator [Actinomycetota bacterium]
MVETTTPIPRLDDIATFVRVVDAGNFAAAAASLYVPRSSVSRQVARLEAHLGVRLMQRTTRNNKLTEAGQELYTNVAGAMAAIESATNVATAHNTTPTGTVRMSAPPDVGAELLPDLIAGFAAAFPAVRVEVELTSGVSDMVRDGLDLAIRNGRPEDAGLTATKLQDTTFALYASESYLANAATIEAITDLPSHDCLLFHGRDGEARWDLTTGPNEPQSTRVTGQISATDLAFIRRACVAGAGIAMLPTLVGDIETRTGALRRVLPDLSARGIPLYLTRPATRFVPRRTEALETFLLQNFPQ